MDLVTHALVGASTGALFGHPLEGSLFGMLPDVGLASFRRLERPPSFYIFCHSPVFILLLGLIVYLVDPSFLPCASLSVFSHIVLDIPTHGKLWAPRPFYPFSEVSFSLGGGEWEWFNGIWYRGLGVSLVWILACAGVGAAEYLWKI